jgi:hypothetical protein
VSATAFSASTSDGKTVAEDAQKRHPLFREATMMRHEDRLTYAARRAYDLARSGSYQDFVSIQEAIMDEGFAETVPWLERPGVIEVLTEICFLSCREKAAA